MTKPADSDQIAKARAMNPDAIKERIQLAHAAQKELCAEISRSEDGEFGLDLFDVLQAMYNSGYKSAASERQAVIEECAKVAEAHGSTIGENCWNHENNREESASTCWHEIALAICSMGE